MHETSSKRLPWLQPGDLDGFFALGIDNLLVLMLIAVLCPTACGLPVDLVFHRLLPGAALSIFVGNIFYGWQARRLALRTGRTDVTALPYGINTVAVIAYCFFVMAPVYAQTKDSDLTWRVGMFACFLSGVIETVGAFCTDWLRRTTPRAALLCPLGGIAITFLGTSFAAQIFSDPVVALVPGLLILVAYGARLKLPGHLPSGLVAVGLGIGLALICRALGWWNPPALTLPDRVGWSLPVPGNPLTVLFSADGWRYFSVILPIGILGVLSSIQILESAEAAGDRFETRSSLLMNGIGTLCAAGFGSAFPTALYIGHPAWKALGARSAYSFLNGTVMMLICLTGGMSAVMRIVPTETALGILVWVGVVMTAQAFREIPVEHAPAVAVGLIPGLASWGLTLIQSAVAASGSSLVQLVPQLQSQIHIRGLISLSQGSLFSAMIIGAFLVHAIDRRFVAAAGWAAAGAVLSLLGLIHAYSLTEAGITNRFGWAAAPDFALAYLLCGAAMLVCAWADRKGWLGVVGQAGVH